MKRLNMIATRQGVNMKKYFNLVSVVVLLSLVGCIKGGEAQPVATKSLSGPVDAPQSSTINLAGKSLSEVLKLKYNKVELNCQLWTQALEHIVTTGEPNDVVSVDLMSLTLPKVLTLKWQLQYHNLAFTVKINSVGLKESLNLNDLDGTKYKASYTPFVDADFTSISYSYSGRPGDGPFIVGPSSGTSIQVYENVRTLALSDVIGVFTDSLGITRSYSDEVLCMVKTEIKPEFRNQFEVGTAK